MNTLEDYRNIINNKKVAFNGVGLSKIPTLNKQLKPHQEHSVRFALEKGSAGLFLDTGLGKSFCALEYGRVIVEYTNKPFLMLAPLAVSKQHEREAVKFGIDAKAIKDPNEITTPRIYITNYERLHLFDVSVFGGVCLDESSILKNYTGKTSRSLIDIFQSFQYKMACTATPAPNDYMELGQHSSFLNVMPSNEMLARWFIADQELMGKYRIKRAALNDFWDWVASWARCVSLPSDLGFSDNGYILPKLNIKTILVESDIYSEAVSEKDGQGMLFRMPDTSATAIHQEKRRTNTLRADSVAEVISSNPKNTAWIVWCDTDYEQDEICKRLDNYVDVRGSQNPDIKEQNLIAFSTGEVPIIVTKPSVAGFGLNWQHCNNMSFMASTAKYEERYQAIKRCHRFGQEKEVNVYSHASDTENNLISILNRKGNNHEAMKLAMASAMKRTAVTKEIRETYKPTIKAILPF